MFKTIIISLFILFCSSLTLANIPIGDTKSVNPDKLIEINYDNSWVLEFHDGIWWWVLYGEDGSRITEIPADF